MGKIINYFNICSFYLILKKNFIAKTVPYQIRIKKVIFLKKEVAGLSG